MSETPEQTPTPAPEESEAKPNIPPAEGEMNEALVAALKAMTGQEFDRTAEAKTWAEEHGKKLKIEW